MRSQVRGGRPASRRGGALPSTPWAEGGRSGLRMTHSPSVLALAYAGPAVKKLCEARGPGPRSQACGASRFASQRTPSAGGGVAVRVARSLPDASALPRGPGARGQAFGSLAGSTINAEPFATPDLLEAQRRKLFYPELLEAYVKSSLHLCIKLAHQSRVLGQNALYESAGTPRPTRSPNSSHLTPWREKTRLHGGKVQQPPHKSCRWLCLV